MASPKLIEFRKAEAAQKMADTYAELKAQMDRIEAKLDAVLGTSKAEEPADAEAKSAKGKGK